MKTGGITTSLKQQVHRLLTGAGGGDLRRRAACCGIPLLVIAASLGLGVWTFDSKLSLSGDNAAFIIQARSLAQGQGLSHINSPDPRPSTQVPFGFPLLLAPLAWAFRMTGCP